MSHLFRRLRARVVQVYTSRHENHVGDVAFAVCRSRIGGGGAVHDGKAGVNRVDRVERRTDAGCMFTADSVLALLFPKQ